MTQKEYQQAKQAGMYARQAGRPITVCPRYGITRDAGVLREAWKQGWTDEDERRRK